MKLYQKGFGLTKIKNRFLNGVLRLLKSWRRLARLTWTIWSLKTFYSRFRLWNDAELFEKMFESLIDDPDLENVSLDSTSIRVHQKATGAKKTPAVSSKTKPSA